MSGCDYNVSVWLSTPGILLVMMGAVFVAYEVVNQFKSETHGAVAFYGGANTFKTGDYKQWERRKYRFMRIGLALIILGSLLQIAALFY